MIMIGNCQPGWHMRIGVGRHLKLGLLAAFVGFAGVACADTPVPPRFVLSEIRLPRQLLSLRVNPPM